MKLLIILFILNLLFPQLIGVDIGVQLPILPMDGLSVPLQDDVLGVIDEYDPLVFVAHDNLAGDHIKNIINQDAIYLLYSNGTKVEYHFKSLKWVDTNSLVNDIYVGNDIIFQTCSNGKILIIYVSK